MLVLPLRWLFLLAVVGATACSGASPRQSDSLVDETAVHAALLNHVHQGAWVEFVLVRGETINGLIPELFIGESAEEQLEFIRAQLPAVDEQTLSSFATASGETRSIDSLPGFNMPHHVLKGAWLDQLKRSPREAIPHLRQMYPDPFGIVTLSRVGFNSDHTQALLYAAYWCGPDCGRGEYVLMEKERGQWRVRSTAEFFVS